MCAGGRPSRFKKLESAQDTGVARSSQRRQRTAILLLQLWHGCQQVCGKISPPPNCLQKLPAQFNIPAEFRLATSPIALSGREWWAVANVGDSLRRLSSLQHRIYNSVVSPLPQNVVIDETTTTDALHTWPYDRLQRLIQTRAIITIIIIFLYPR